jgi:hypothetical protein
MTILFPHTEIVGKPGVGLASGHIRTIFPKGIEYKVGYPAPGPELFIGRRTKWFLSVAVTANIGLAILTYVYPTGLTAWMDFGLMPASALLTTIRAPNLVRAFSIITCHEIGLRPFGF